MPRYVTGEIILLKLMSDASPGLTLTTLEVQVVDDHDDPTSVTVFIPGIGVYDVYRTNLSRPEQKD